MLEKAPARSVTRFMLPMADVMALLFSLFLLLPHLERELGPAAGRSERLAAWWSPEEQRQVREELARLRRFREAPPSDRFFTVIVEIEGATGRLLHPDLPAPVSLQGGAELEARVGTMTRKHLAEARALDKRLYCILALRPPLREITGTDLKRLGDLIASFGVDFDLVMLPSPDRQ